MNKNLRKVVSMLLILVLAMSLAACGSKGGKSGKKSSLEEISAEELLEKYSEASKTVKGVNMNLNLGLNLSASGQDIKIKCNADSKSKVEELAMYMKVDMNIDLAGEAQDMTVELYEMAGESAEKADTYTNMLGSWTYQEVDLSDNKELQEKISNIAGNIDFSSIKEYFDDVKTEAVGDNYEVTLKINTKSLIDMLKSSVYASYFESADLSGVPDTTITITLVIDGKTYLAKKLSLDMDLESINVQGMELKVSDFVCEVDYISYDEPEIELPQEAVEAKENGSTSFSIFE